MAGLLHLYVYNAIRREPYWADTPNPPNTQQLYVVLSLALILPAIVDLTISLSTCVSSEVVVHKHVEMTRLDHYPWRAVTVIETAFDRRIFARPSVDVEVAMDILNFCTEPKCPVELARLSVRLTCCKF